MPKRYKGNRTHTSFQTPYKENTADNIILARLNYRLRYKSLLKIFTHRNVGRRKNIRVVNNIELVLIILN